MKMRLWAHNKKHTIGKQKGEGLGRNLTLGESISRLTFLGFMPTRQLTYRCLNLLLMMMRIRKCMVRILFNIVMNLYMGIFIDNIILQVLVQVLVYEDQFMGTQ